MAHQCCDRKCDGDDECTVAFLCDRCNAPIDEEDYYFEIGKERICEGCFDKHVDKNFRNIAHREVN